MWYFTYFSMSFIYCSAISILLDLNCISDKKHKYRTPNEVLTVVKDIMPLVCLNLVAIVFPGSLIIENVIETRQRNEYGFILNFTAILAIADFVTYWVHRIFHSPSLYWFHKTHHEFQFPIAMAALYAHPIDFLFINFIPFNLPIFLLWPPDYVIKISILFAVLVTTFQSHGGYTFFSDSHLLHHKHYKVNYGLGLSDRIFGTFR